jgi:hypothetical protein
MHVLVADLDEDAAGLGEQVAGGGEAVAEVAEVAVDAQLPGVAERLDLLRLAGQVVGLRADRLQLVQGEDRVLADDRRGLDPAGRGAVYPDNMTGSRHLSDTTDARSADI